MHSESILAYLGQDFWIINHLTQNMALALNNEQVNYMIELPPLEKLFDSSET